MISKEIKYIGFYDIPNSRYKRVATLAAINKMDYICDTLNKIGYSVSIISPAWFSNETSAIKYQPSTTLHLNEQKRLILCPSINVPIKMILYLKILLSLVWLFCWLILYVKKNEKVLLYHVPWLLLPVRFAKKIKKFQIILEVEEIYGQVWKINSVMKKWEEELLEIADSYIAVSEILSSILGNKTKAIIYGSYSLCKLKEERTDPTTINIVYAGSIDYLKGGAYNSVQVLRYLSEKYVLHICGYGNDKCVNELTLQIDRINNELRRRACIYHGEKTGDEFSKILKKCHIAINPQYEGNHMHTAFPSKILTYLSHNLRVVSTRIKSIEVSELTSIIIYSKNDTPEAIAEEIIKINIKDPYNSEELIRQLDYRFVIDMKAILDEE